MEQKIPPIPTFPLKGGRGHLAGPKGGLVAATPRYDNGLSNVLREVLKDLQLEKTFDQFPELSAAKRVLEWFKSH